MNNSLKEIAAWRANRGAAKAKTKAASRKAKAAVVAPLYVSHPDPVLDTIRRIDAAAELIAPVLTDGVLLSLINRTLTAGRLELCGCLEAVVFNSRDYSAFDRQFANALREYIRLRGFDGRAEVCIDCHSDRCNKGGAK